ncbi:MULTISPECIES: DNA cytosine methyltransferase [unclassified Rhizobium]|uniref:DNA cytosine methyltransferase n=1 Tax=unclassified Rhizobium TaxID=2613769 RepID=UPI001FEE9E0C|nr:MULTISPECIES: DNA cytosine methyltransferase [unclassified Rhizobium]NMN73889.1 DNA (cytosine-5)-methyltransferase 1 [Rhizobium sp. 57MFTsu3.2]
MISAPIIVDSFAGGGGASTGIEMALGRSPNIAINHNAAALALHAANHPETLHLSENIFKVDPLDHVAGKHVGLAWFSPDCKHFSKAKGGKPVERNIRDLAWVIVLWAERAKPDVIIMENVEEWKDWGPLIETERGLMPCPDSRGETFQKWCKAMRRAGYKIQHRELRACDYGAPTIRKRLFLIARRDGKPIVWPEATHGAPDDREVISGRKKPWRTAAECIDWSLPCPSIFDTTEEIWEKYQLRAIRPLAKNTMARVARGMKRYVLDAERPFLVQTGYGERAGQAPRAMSVDRPLGTVVASGIKHNVVTPHLSAFYGPGDGGKDRSASVEEPVRVVTTENRHAIIAPILTYAQQGGANRSVEEPHHTICASKKDQNSVIIPTLVGCGGRAGQSRPRGGDEPSATITAKADTCAAVAFVAQNNNDSRRIGGVNPGRSAEKPMSTVTASGAQQGAVTAFISRQFGTSTGHEIGKPLGTTTADGGGKSLLVAPYLQAYYGTGDGGEEDQPCRTITTKDRHGHVEATIEAPPFISDQEVRARQVADFMRSFGFWDDREFVTLTIGGTEFVIVDIGMRMLSPRELYNAQGFPPDYQIDTDAIGKPFPKNVQVSCVGNSVCPPVAAAIVGANCQDLVEYREAAE